MRFHESSRKHGVDEQDSLHAVDHALAIKDIGEDPERWLVLGPDRAGNLLEVIVLMTLEGEQLVIHAMKMRPQFQELLQP